MSRFINPMLPTRLVLIVMCVCECVCGRADASALINEPAIIIYTSCSSSYHPIYSHHSLISFVRSLFVVLDVWWSRLRSCSCSCGFAHSGFVTSLRVHSGFVTALQESSSEIPGPLHVLWRRGPFCLCLPVKRVSPIVSMRLLSG